MNQRILTLRDALATHPPRIAYPEGTNPIILSAVRQLADWHAVRPVLVADSPTAVKQADIGKYLQHTSPYPTHLRGPAASRWHV